jgi:hypothetical protein
MKTNFRFTILLSALLTTTLVSIAQDEAQPVPQSIPRWISEKGYWVIESNVKTPFNSIIHFYNNDNVLVYRERVEGVRINLNRTRTKMRLKKILEQSILAWQKDHLPKQDEQWDARAFREP